MNFTQLSRDPLPLVWAVLSHVVDHADLRFLRLERAPGQFFASMFGYSHDTISVTVLQEPTRIAVKYEWDEVEVEQRVIGSAEEMEALVSDMARNLRALYNARLQETRPRMERVCNWLQAQIMGLDMASVSAPGAEAEPAFRPEVDVPNDGWTKKLDRYGGNDNVVCVLLHDSDRQTLCRDGVVLAHRCRRMIPWCLVVRSEADVAAFVREAALRHRFSGEVIPDS